jgi:hypothetical protein
MRKRLVGVLVAMVAAVVWAGPAAAAPPPNDSFAAATPLAVGQEIAASNIESTAQLGEPQEFGESPGCKSVDESPRCSRSVWFSFQAAQAGKYTIETCDASSELDSMMFVYTGAALGSLTKVAYNDDGDRELGPPCGAASNNFGSRLTIDAETGTVYRVEIVGFSGDQGFFYIRSYAGDPQPRPQPDTEILRNSSLVGALGYSRGEISGPRRVGSFALASEAPGATFECSLDGAPYAACSSPVVYEGLAEGTTHFFQARAVTGGAADPTPARQAFTIDRTPPDTTLSGPSGPIPGPTAKWMLGQTEPDNRGSLPCRFDSLVGSCTYETTFSALCSGLHSLTATAADMAGNLDPSPATDTAFVTGGPACAPPTVSATSSSGSTETTAEIRVPFDDRGAAGSARVAYGPTTSYGTEVTQSFVPRELSQQEIELGLHKELHLFLAALDPGTLYHYRVTVTTPFGTATSADQTLTAKPASGPLPTMFYGVPVPGRYVASLPETIGMKGQRTTYNVLIDSKGPINPGAPQIQGRPLLPDTAVGSQAADVQAVDLEPATTYHYRFLLHQYTETTSNEVLGPEGTFTTLPPLSAVPTVTKRRFILRRGNVKVGRLTRRSKRLKARAHGLPAKTVVKVTLFVGGSKQTARKKASKRGLAIFKPSLSKRIRKALHKKKVRHYRVKVTASPPGEQRSSITLTKKLPR